MADFEQQDGEQEYIEVPDERTESEKEYDRQIERLDSFFAGVQPGVTLLIERLKPSWCSGLLEEITVTDEVIDLQYFIDNWGGELLTVKVRGKGGKLKGSYKVPLHSYPPLRYGQRLYPYKKGERFQEDDLQKDNPAPSPPVVVNPPQSAVLEKIVASLPSILPFLMQWLQQAEERRRNDMAIFMQMAKQNSGGGGIKDLSNLGTVYTQLAEVFRQQGAGGDGGGGNELDFVPQALDIVKMVLQPGGGEKAQPIKGGLTPPAMSSPRAISAPPERPANVTKLTTKTAPAPSLSSSAPAPSDLVSNITALPPNEAAETIIAALGRMEPSKRDAAIGHFLTEFNSTMGEGGEEEIDDFEGDAEQEDIEQRGIR